MLAFDDHQLLLIIHPEDSDCHQVQAYMSGQGMARNRGSPLCRHKDLGGHICRDCSHKDTKSIIMQLLDIIKPMRAMVQAFTKGRHDAGIVLLCTPISSKPSRQPISAAYISKYSSQSLS